MMPSEPQDEDAIDAHDLQPADPFSASLCPTLSIQPPVPDFSMSTNAFSGQVLGMRTTEDQYDDACSSSFDPTPSPRPSSSACSLNQDATSSYIFNELATFPDIQHKSSNFLDPTSTFRPSSSGRLSYNESVADSVFDTSIINRQYYHGYLSTPDPPHSRYASSSAWSTNNDGISDQALNSLTELGFHEGTVSFTMPNFDDNLSGVGSSFASITSDQDGRTSLDGPSRNKAEPACVVCGFAAANYKRLDEHGHEEDHHPYKCSSPNCEKPFSRRDTAHRHEQESHNDPKIVCQECWQRGTWRAFRRKTALRSHQKKDHRASHLRGVPVLSINTLGNYASHHSSNGSGFLGQAAGDSSSACPQNEVEDKVDELAGALNYPSNKQQLKTKLVNMKDKSVENLTIALSRILRLDKGKARVSD